MSFRDYMKKMISNYFMIVTCINLAMLLMGLSMEQDTRFGYEAFFLPLLYGFLGVLPSLILYSKRDLSVKETLVRELLHLILLEVVLLSFMYWNGMRDFLTLVAVAISVAVICGVVTLLSWLLDLRRSTVMNQELKEYQKRNKK